MPHSIWLLALLFVGGVALLVLGGDLLVRGASRIAERLGVSPLVIGLTIVAFGTSTPELAVNLSAALRGTDSIGFGNVVGSNIANIGLILGLSALLRPIEIHSDLFRRDLPFMLLASVLVIACAFAPPHVDGADGLSRPDGALLLATFGLCLYYTLKGSRQQGVVGPELADEAAHLARARSANVPMFPAALCTLAGLALLMGGGQITERAAVGIARGAGLSETLIGLTIVAVATSLPELATSIIAALRRKADIAVGNVVGSNIYNVLFILGLTTMVDPVTLPPDAGPSLVAMLVTSFALFPMCLTGRRLTRAEGAGLLAMYAAYLGYEIWRAGA